MQSSAKVDLFSFLPTSDEADNWALVLEAQLANNLIVLIVWPLKPDIPQPLRRLVSHPPPIEKLDSTEAFIHMLRLIDDPNTSAECVVILLDMSFESKMAIHQI